MIKNNKLFVSSIICIMSVLLLNSCNDSSLASKETNLNNNTNTENTTIASNNTENNQQKKDLKEPITYYNQGSIYFMADINSTPEKIAEGERPSLSPQQDKIAYQDNGIHIYNLKTKTTKVLDKTTGNAFSPKWSPDGEWIAYIDRNDGYKLTLVKPDNSEIKVIFDKSNSPSEMFFQPEWAIDSKSIFVHDLNTLFEINIGNKKVTETPTSKIAQKSSSISSEDNFAPCPTDKNLMVFTQFVNDNSELENYFGEPGTAIFLHNSKDETNKRLSPAGFLCFNPVWSKDGKSLFFSGYKDLSDVKYPFKIYKLNLENNEIIEITKGENVSL